MKERSGSYIQCIVCPKTFYAYPSQVKQNKRFCSMACRNKDLVGQKHPNWKPKVEKNCALCGKHYSLQECWSKRYNSRFCSNECKNKWQSTLSGAETSNWKGGRERTKQTCKQCSKEFFTPARFIERGQGLFCSMTCFGVYSVISMPRANTKIERIIEAWLLQNKISFQKQVPIENFTVVDFLVEHNTIIYCDGCFWHGCEVCGYKDFHPALHAWQNIRLKELNYKVIHLKEHEILEGKRPTF